VYTLGIDFFIRKHYECRAEGFSDGALASPSSPFTAHAVESKGLLLVAK
jgi:hypothetical protein